MCKTDCGLEGGVRNPNHDRYASIDEFDGLSDKSLSLFQAEIGVFLGLDAGRYHHRRAAVLNDVVDLAPQRRPVNLEIGGKRRQRRNDQFRRLHVDLLPTRYTLSLRYDIPRTTRPSVE